RAPANPGDRHQPAVRLRRRDRRAGRPRGPGRPGRPRGTPAETGDQTLPDGVRLARRAARRVASRDPSDSTGGRAGDGGVPRSAERAERPHAVPHGPQAGRTHRPRTAGPDLFHRLRPRAGAGGRAPAGGRRATDHRPRAPQPRAGAGRDRGGVLALGGGCVAGTEGRGPAPLAPRRDRPTGRNRTDLCRRPGGERADAAPVRAAGIRGRRPRRRRRPRGTEDLTMKRTIIASSTVLGCAIAVALLLRPSHSIPTGPELAVPERIAPALRQVIASKMRRHAEQLPALVSKVVVLDYDGAAKTAGEIFDEPGIAR